MNIYDVDVLFAFIGMILNLKGSTYRQLAETSGLPEFTIRKLKARSQRLTTKKLEMLFEGLEVEMEDYLLFFEYLKDSGAHSFMVIRE